MTLKRKEKRDKCNSSTLTLTSEKNEMEREKI